MVYPVHENQYQYEFYIKMLVLDHYDYKNNHMEQIMDVDPFFLQAQSKLLTTGVSPLVSFHLSSPLVHYSLYLNVFDGFVIPTSSLNYLDPFPIGFDCNQVWEGVVL